MAASSLPLSLPFLLRSRSSSSTRPPLPFRCSHLLLSLPSSIVCLSAHQNPSSGHDREESRWLREEQRWIREEQRWLREEQRWTRERETLLQEIADLQLRIRTLESQQGTSDTISNIAALLQALKEKNRISESGSSAMPMVLENTREELEEVEEEEEEEEEEEVVVVEKQVVAEEKVRVSEKARVSKRVTLKVGSEGEEVQAMQEALMKLGFYSGEEDMEFSSFSSGTARAVKTWQASLGVREDGVMTEELLQMLFMDQDVKTDKDEASTLKQETKEAGNGAVKTQVSEKQQSIIKDQDTKKKCITCRGEGRLMCLECDGTGEPNIEPQFMELVDEDAKCVYCEGLGYTVCDVCEGKTAV
ncbi:Protein disulfide isomerase pTAC5 [Hirschfeldia incana]|nr:Protein disulfide isomerase pTAC5 [Hirschfeldia incana]